MVESCLSPDYYRLLREGRRGLSSFDGRHRRGFTLGDVAVWIALAPDESTAWTTPGRPDVGHGMNVRVLAQDRHFHLSIGCGRFDEEDPGTFGLPE